VSDLWVVSYEAYEDLGAMSKAVLLRVGESRLHSDKGDDRHFDESSESIVGGYAIAHSAQKGPRWDAECFFYSRHMS